MKSSLTRIRRFFPFDWYIERGDHVQGRTWFDTDFRDLYHCFNREDIYFHTKEFWFGKTHIILDWEVLVTDKMRQDKNFCKSDTSKELIASQA